MREQRRAAHRGSAGLRQTWEGVFARALVRSRYMSLFHRLLTMGMRPAGSTSPFVRSIPTSATASGSIGAAPLSHPVVRGRVVSGPDPSTHLASAADRGGMRRSVSMGAPMTEEGSSLDGDDGGDGHPAGGVSSRGHGDDHWGQSSVGGSSADIYKLAGQIRRMGGLDRYRIEGLREAQVKGGGGHKCHFLSFFVNFLSFFTCLSHVGNSAKAGHCLVPLFRKVVYFRIARKCRFILYRGNVPFYLGRPFFSL